MISRQKTVLLIESGPVEKRAYLKELLGISNQLVLVKNSSVRNGLNQWAREYFQEQSVIDVPFKDTDKAILQIANWSKKRGSQTQDMVCFTYQEEAVVFSNFLAKSFGWPVACRDPESVRNKLLMRRYWSKARIPQPQFYSCSSLDEVLSIINNSVLDYDYVLKPVEMMGSLGVSRISSRAPEKVERAFERAVSSDFADEDLKFGFEIGSSVLLEEFIASAIEISIEAAVVNGEVIPICVFEKLLRDQQNFEEIGHRAPPCLDEKIIDKALRYLQVAISATQIESCIIHSEFRIRQDGQPILIEVAARLAGDRIPFLVKRATGINLFELALSLAAGKIPDILIPSCISPAGIRFFCTDEERASARALASQHKNSWQEVLESENPMMGYVEW